MSDLILAPTAKPIGPNAIVIDLATAILAALLMALAARDGWPGSIAALIALAILTVSARNMPWRSSSFVQKLLVLLSLGGCAAIFIEPGPLNMTMFWVTTGAFNLSRRSHDNISPASIVQTLLGRALFSPVHAITDVRDLTQLYRQSETPNRSLVKRGALLPVLATLIFAILFAASNPIIETLLYKFSFQLIFDQISYVSCFVAIVVLIAVWTLLRSTQDQPQPGIGIDSPAPGWHSSYFAPITVIVTLLILNAMFATHNALDFGYVWSGVDLPPGMTHAAYVHRGTDTLIITVLLAAALMIVALWPGSRTEKSPIVRLLVYLWIVQNVVLVASSAARTQSYIDDYGLTLMRLSGLLWMALVATGLLLITIRVITHRSNRWLVDCNIAAAFILLWIAGFADFNGYVANYNVNRAIAIAEQDANASSIQLDLSYLQGLGTSALPASRKLLAFLQKSPRTWSAWYAGKYAHLAVADLVWCLTKVNEDRQSSWRGWTLHGHFLSK